MSLNPSDSGPMIRIRNEELNKSFNGGSPYFDMYRCGYYGVPLEDCVSKCRANGISVRPKDITAWEDGKWKHDMIVFGSETGYEQRIKREPSIPMIQTKLDDFPLLPISWEGTTRRFFPCTEDNKPMEKWGWSRDYTPNLYTLSDAKSLSPVGWVGQNMLYQPFIVIDIDGRGHGEEDLVTIDFGRIFSDITMTMEDPTKPGSFHLYFSTNRLIPVKHFPWAKIDLMGNAVNAAVYLKNKVSNNLPMRELDDKVWNALITFQEKRKEQQCL